MHQCLLINEVIERIAQYALQANLQDLLAGNRDNRKYVVAFALTCRALCDPCLNAIWRDLPAIDSLAYVFQPDVHPVLVTIHGQKVAKDLTGAPTHDNWLRFSSYAKRVRTLRYDESGDSYRQSHCQLLVTLSAYRRSRCLLPNLQALTWRNPVPKSMPLLSLFMSSALTAISVDITSDYDATRLWDMIPHFAPALQSVSVSVSNFAVSQATCKALSKALRGLQMLTHLRLEDKRCVSPLSSEDIEYLSQCSTLSTLRFSLSRDFPSALISKDIPDNYFASLKSLYLYSPTASALSHAGLIVRAIRPLTLRSLGISAFHLCTAAELMLFMEAAATHELSSLSIRLEEAYKEIDFDDSHFVNPETLAPVFRLRQLEEFALCGFPLCLTGSTLKMMAQSWPHIKSLHCVEQDDEGPNPGFMLKDLEFLAQYCPKLQYLLLALNMTPPEVDSRRLPIRRTVGLRLMLNIPYCKVIDPLRTAAYLTSIFPHVEVIPSHSFDETSFYALEDALEVLQKTRQQEIQYRESYCSVDDESAEQN